MTISTKSLKIGDLIIDPQTNEIGLIEGFPDESRVKIKFCFRFSRVNSDMQFYKIENHISLIGVLFHDMFKEWDIIHATKINRSW